VATASEPFITAKQLNDRVGEIIVDRILRAPGSGKADPEAIERVCRDASSWVRGNIGPVYDLSKLPEDSAEEIVRISLDVAHAYLAQRHPEIIRVDGFKMLEQAAKDIKKIRFGEANLGTREEPAPANEGTHVSSGDPTCPEPKPRFSDNWGAY
jgi:phage gp36-like protein